MLMRERECMKRESERERARERETASNSSGSQKKSLSQETSGGSSEGLISHPDPWEIANAGGKRTQRKGALIGGEWQLMG